MKQHKFDINFLMIFIQYFLGFSLFYITSINLLGTGFIHFLSSTIFSVQAVFLLIVNFSS